MVGHIGKVLIVDDDADFREALRRCLEIHGYVVMEAKDGLEAAMQLETIPCEAVITDYRMPRMDGLQLLASMRRETHQTAVLLVSASMDEEDERRARAYGAHSVLRKPFDRWHLLEALRSAMHTA